MTELEKVRELEIIRKKGFEMYPAGKEGDKVAVFLPKRQVPEGAEVGDKVEVLTCEDLSDRLIATTGKSKLRAGETAKLEVKGVVEIGAFLDMGLEKDLLLPFREQTHPVRKGEQCFVTLHVGKSRRLAATMCVYSHMSNQLPYRAEDWITGTVYEINETTGIFVVVGHKYYGLIPEGKSYGRFRKGDTVQARVTRTWEDGKLDLYVREKPYVQMDTDAEKVLKVMDQFDGVLPLNDKAKPEVIIRELSMSKNALKRAAGGLLRESKIHIMGKTVECV